MKTVVHLKQNISQNWTLTQSIDRVSYLINQIFRASNYVNLQSKIVRCTNKDLNNRRQSNMNDCKN